jgi:nitrogen fixation/metabolism regulation signal transduction histidine kinase
MIFLLGVDGSRLKIYPRRLLIGRQTMLFVPIGLALLLVLITINLIQYIGKSNRDLTHFLLSIRQGAFTESYTSGVQDEKNWELAQAMDDIVAEFSRLAAEKEMHYQYLKTVNDNINIGIVSFDDDNRVRTANPAAKALLKLIHLASLTDLARVDQRLYNAVADARPEQRQVVKVVIGDELVNINLFMKEIMIQNNRMRILLLQNLNSELEAKEIEAWEQLLGVMTHEIMNSITPIASLSEASRKILVAADSRLKPISELSEANLEDVADSVSTIAQRSKGLLQFVKSYRDYSGGRTPHFENADLRSLVERTGSLVRLEMEERGIRFEMKLPATSMKATALDVAMVEHALLNLLKNAMDALAGRNDGRVMLALSENSNSRALITVADNGPGIEEDVLPKIFIPFYSTKEKGSGIGLSLTKQIMKVHRGHVRVHTQPGAGTKFTLNFPLD